MELDSIEPPGCRRVPGDRGRRVSSDYRLILQPSEKKISGGTEQRIRERRWLNRNHSIKSCHAISWTVLRAIPSCSVEAFGRVEVLLYLSVGCENRFSGDAYSALGENIYRVFLTLFSWAYTYMHFSVFSWLTCEYTVML